MAKSKNNVITYGLSGKIGDLLIFRQVKGQTVVSKTYETNKKASEKQTEHRKRFQQAVIYAKSATQLPETKDIYEAEAKKSKKTPFLVAVADFFHAPDIETVDLSEYAGNKGDVIRIAVSDDIAVKTVHVHISNSDGSLVEEGNAVQNTDNMWVYTAMENNDSLDGDRIAVSASDHPGNIAETNYEL